MDNPRVKVLFAGGALVCIALGIFRSNPDLRTKIWFSLKRRWFRREPSPRVVRMLQRIERLFAPLVPVWLELEPNVKMLLDPHDYLCLQLLSSVQWEPESWCRIEKQLPAGGTFVDVGAHIGYYSLKAARVVGDSGQVIAIEPNPGTVERLRGNIVASGATAIRVQPVACADIPTTLEFFTARRQNTGASSFSRENASRAGVLPESCRVTALPLDTILEALGVRHIDAIKIDVEGAELLVLEGATKTIESCRPMLLIELMEPQLRAMGSSTVEVVEFLRRFGYKPRQVTDDNTEFAQ